MMRSLKVFLFGLGFALVLIGARGGAYLSADEQQTGASRPAQSARERPPMPQITQPVMFNAPEADRILAALQVFPADNPWNEDISRRPVHPNSRNFIASVGPREEPGVQPGHGFHPGASQPGTSAGPDHHLSR